MIILRRNSKPDELFSVCNRIPPGELVELISSVKLSGYPRNPYVQVRFFRGLQNERIFLPDVHGFLKGFDYVTSKEIQSLNLQPIK